MKKSLLLLGSATIATLSLACAAEQGPSPVDVDGDEATGGTTGVTGGTTGVTGGATGVTGGATGVTGGTTGATGGSTATPLMATFVTGGLGTDPGAGVTNVNGNAGFEGYLWTAAEEGSTITPDMFTGSELCASGTMGPSYEEWAMIGWNINQVIDPVSSEGGDKMDIAPTGTGLNVTVADNAGSGLRVQIQDIAGNSWCADAPAGGNGMVPYSSMVPECWTGGTDTTPYAKQPIAQISIQAYAGSDTATTDYNFCVVTIAEY